MALLNCLLRVANTERCNVLPDIVRCLAIIGKPCDIKLAMDQNVRTNGFFGKLADHIEREGKEINVLHFDVNSCTVLASAVLARTSACEREREVVSTLCNAATQLINKARSGMGISANDRDRLNRITDSIINYLQKIEAAERVVNPEYRSISGPP